MFNAEYYDASLADESDPDPDFVTESDNLGDVFERIEEYLELAIDAPIFLDNDNGFDRYAINITVDNRTTNIGIALIGVK